MKLYPLTYSQKNILNIDKLYPNMAINSIAGTFRIKGSKNIGILKKAINLFIKNNDGMRIRIKEDKNNFLQYIEEFEESNFEIVNFEHENELYIWEKEESNKSFPIVNVPLFYFKIINIKDREIGYYIKCSHIISDAWTFALLVNEILENYIKLIKNDSINNKEISIIEHLECEEKYLKSERCNKDYEYWIENLKDLQVKTLLKNGKKSSIKAERKSIVLPEKLSKKIYEYCKANKTSPFNLFIAALSMYIKRATGRNDIIIGTTTLNRVNKREKSMIGMFVNTCPIRVKIDDKMLFGTIIKELTLNNLALLKHQKYPYEVLLNELKEKYDFKDNLFDIVLNYQNAKFVKEEGNIDYTTRWHFNGSQIESLIININDREESGQLIMNYDYLTSCFKEKEIEYLHKHMVSLLWHAIDNDKKEIEKIEMLPEEEQDRILNKFNSIEVSEEISQIQIEENKNRNVKVYILDKNKVAVPIGIAGELYTNYKFDGKEIDNPYVKGEKIYNTGKIARWYSKGDIEILKQDDERLLIPKFNMKSSKKVINIVLTGSFTIEPIKEYIEHFAKIFGYKLNMKFTEYNQVLQELINEESILSQNKTGINVVLVRLKDYIRDNSQSEQEQIKIIQETSKNISELLSKTENTTLFGLFSEADENSIEEVINNENKTILEAIKANKNIFVLNTDELSQNYSIENKYDEINDKTAHIPYIKEYYAALSAEIVRKIIALRRTPYKVIVLDCDNTLWKGICGEGEVEVTENYKKLQNFMLKKEQEGMLLTICSKNSEKDVFNVFENNKNMLIQKENIANWKVNWDNKADNIKEMAKELNLGLDSFIFIDDNPMECINMMENVPEVLTLNLPEEDSISMFLNHIWATDNLLVTKEDKERSKRYIEEQKRKEAEKEVSSIDEFIKTLNIQVSMREVEPEEIIRASQMTLRTNQFNLSTKRRSEKEIKELTENKNYKVFVAEAKDKFGDYGIIGLIILKKEENQIKIDTLLLSCRVLGRKVENAILQGIKIYAENENVEIIAATYIKTEKNQPILNFIEKESFTVLNIDGEKTEYEMLTKDIFEVKDVELFYNKKIITKEDSKNPSFEMTTEIKNNKSIIAGKNIKLINEKLIEHAKNKEYLKVLLEPTGQKILNAIEEKEIDGEYVKPETETEEKLAKIWQEALKIKKIGITNDFFNIGGDSLSAVFVLSQISKEFNVTLDLTNLFTNRTIKDIAKLIESKTENRYEEIPRIEEKEYYELSSAQTRMYLINQIEGESTKYNECQMLKVEGPLDKEKLEKAFNKVIKRHEILRTGFFIKENKPVQKVFKDIKLKIDYIETDKVEETAKEFVKTFALEKPPLFRVKLIKISENEHIMLFDIHHIVIDGTSFGILIKEVLGIYDNKELEEVKTQYKDFAVWQNDFAKTKEMKRQEEYWLKQFEGEIPVLNIPTDFPRPPVQSSKGKKLYFTTDKELTGKIKEICKETETTLFMFLFAVYNVLLYRYTGQEDIVVGIPVAGRKHPETKDMLGMFINNLAVRTYPKGEMSFKDYLQEVKETIIKDLENQDYQYEKLINKLNIQRDMSRNPLFDVMFSLQNMDMPEIKTDELMFEQCQYDNGQSKQDLSIFAWDREDNLDFEVEFCTDLFKDESIKRFNEHYIKCIMSFVNKSDCNIGEFNFLTEIEDDSIKKFNFTDFTYDEFTTIKEMFEKQVKETPNKIAIVCENNEISYSELNKKSNKLARILKMHGVKTNISVGVMIKRSIDMISALLGVIKAGGFYVPIDPDYPPERIKYILENSKTQALITETSLENNIVFTGNIILTDKEIYTDDSDLTTTCDSDSLIYTIYTSGSTGNPKGVMLTNKNITNFIYGVQNRIKFSQNEIILGITTVSFDIFVLETWLPLCLGQKIILASDSEQFNVAKILQLINDKKITSIQMTPSRMKSIMKVAEKEDFNNIKNILVGGEPLTYEVFNLIKEKSNAKIYNMYGPTETAVWSSIGELSDKKEIDIGEPIANTQFYIINSYGAIQPFNIEGELCIGGYGLSNGYKDRKDLTDEKFIFNREIGKMLYKTGDKVKLTSDLKLKFIGRMDNQIKFRGYRIEIEDIESNMMKHPCIDKCIVVLNKEAEQLCAYYISKSDITEESIKEYLFDKIPNYMIPTYFEEIKELPFTPNGKIDRKKLSEKSIIAVHEDHNMQIRGEIQQKLAQCFENALDINEIKADENFFTCGGDSLKVIKLTMEIYNAFGIELNYKDIFFAPTIIELSKKISNILINGYKENIDLGENYSLLNNKKGRNIFAFPPITGYGLAFNDISKYINDFSLYAFNYIEDDNKIDKYIQDLRKIQPNGPYFLLGFSAGADIVIDLANKIQEKTIVVLMDGFFGKIAKKDIEEKLRFFVTYSMEYAGIKDENSFFKDILEKKIRSYMLYMADKEKFDKPIESNIYFIQSEEMKDEDVEEIKKLTNGKLIKYRAVGKHFDLLKKEFADKNAKIIQNVFNNAEVQND